MNQDSKDETQVVKTDKNSSVSSCIHKIVDYLSRRDHSEKELREKLTQKKFNQDDISKSLSWALEHQLLRPPEELTKILTEMLLKRGKGRHYIIQYLKKRGLPPPVMDEIDKEMEFHKALEFARQKLKPGLILDRATREKIGRKLITRGFSLDVVRTVIYEKL